MIKVWHRKLNRLVKGDYSRPGWYFVTVCSKERERLFGEIVGKKMFLFKLGLVSRNKILEIPKHFKNVLVDCYVIMPNHIHILIRIKDVGNQVVDAYMRPKNKDRFGRDLILMQTKRR